MLVGPTMSGTGLVEESRRAGRQLQLQHAHVHGMSRDRVFSKKPEECTTHPKV